MKITSKSMAKRIAALTGGGKNAELTTDEVLEAIPELKGFDTLAEAVETAFHDACFELDPDTTFDHDNHEATRYFMEKSYTDAVGEAPAEFIAIKDQEETDPEDTSVLAGSELKQVGDKFIKCCSKCGAELSEEGTCPEGCRV